MIPTDIFTWTTQEEGRELQKLAVNKRCLELGAFAGFTTVCMAKTARVVYSVDIHSGWEFVSGKESLPAFLKSLSRHNVLDKVIICIGTTEAFLPVLPKLYFDLIFIDASHDYDSVKQDIGLSLPLLKPKATISFHDYRPNEEGQSVVRAVDEFIEAGAFQKIHNVESLLVCRLP